MALEFKDYYATLGVPRTASDDELKKAFRKLARQYHPDVAKDKKAAEEKFKEINEAYEVLGNPENRKKYDTLGANWKQGAGFQPPPGWEQAGGRGGRRTRRTGGSAEDFEFRFGGTGFSDFFEQFFSGANHRGGPGGFPGADDGGDGSASGYAQRGADIEGDLAVSVDEVLRGSVRTVSFQRVNSHTGKAETQQFKVRIPPGVQEGQLIRVAGKGETGFGGGTAGDLFLRVRISPHPDFQVQGSDLVTELDLAPWEAVLGATVPVPTLEAPVNVRIPAGTNPGQQLRVRGRGLPRGQAGERGDLYVKLLVKLPAKLTDDERALWEKLAAGSGFKPRES
jgi:curved DNA-binding protein